jgi:CMP-N,N'-diacetyllegionaminic acid synthase
MANVVAIIPARSGSKSVRDKNVKLLAGKPLLAYSIAVALQVKLVERIIVSTDSQRYANIAREYGAEVPFLRPAEISGDGSTAYDFIKHALDWMGAHEGHRPTYIVLLLPTTPLREVCYIESAIKTIIGDDKATGLRSVHEMSETAYKTVEIDGGYMKCICTGSFDVDAANLPRQRYPKTYHPNGYVDVIKSDYVIKNGKLFGDRVIAYITPRITEVDTIEDYVYLEYQVAKEPAIVNKIFEKEKSQA